MRKITVISLLLVLLISSCSSIRQFRYMSKAKAPKGTFRTEIPFDISNGLIVLKVKLSGSDKEYDFMLDSGAPISVIYKEVYEASKAETVMSYKVTDTHGKAIQSDYMMLDLEIGNSLFKDVFTAYSPEVSEMIRCIASGGIIGADLMQTANWQIDFENKKIVISDTKKSSLPDLKDYQKISFTKRSPMSSMPWVNILPGMTVDVKVNGTLFKDVYIDLGSTRGLTLPKNAKTDTLFKNDLNEILIGYSSFGLFGAKLDTTMHYTSSNMYVKDFKLNNHSIEIGEHYGHLLGTEVFTDYLMYIDFRKENLYLKPAKKEVSTDEEKLGFSMLYDCKTSTCYVSSVFEGSSAKLAGLQIHDTITEVNGQPIPVFTEFCEFRVWNKKMRKEELLIVKTSRRDEVFKIEKGVVVKW